MTVATDVFDDLTLTEPLALLTLTVAVLPGATVTDVGDTVRPEWDSESELEVEEATVTGTLALLSPLRIVTLARPADRAVTVTLPDE